jgi:chromosome segregation ATPase
VESHKEEVATFKSSKADLERQLEVVNEEFTLAKSQMDAKWTLYQEALEQHDEISKEFTRLKEHQEAKYKEAKELRDLISSQQNAYYENRRFSQSVCCHTLAKLLQ